MGGFAQFPVVVTSVTVVPEGLVTNVVAVTDTPMMQTAASVVIPAEHVCVPATRKTQLLVQAGGFIGIGVVALTGGGRTFPVIF